MRPNRSYMFFGVMGAQDVWTGCLGRLQKSCLEQNDFLQLVTGLMAKLSSEE